VVDQLVAKGVGWVPIADALGVTRQAARQAFMRRSPSGHGQRQLSAVPRGTSVSTN
jgi:hypothetical protein